ncbi:MAG TPA: Hsp33 family molecular chaperone HslO [bacterium]|nr:Hsp33 family molecular chaperone HslO [bacterium]
MEDYIVKAASDDFSFTVSVAVTTRLVEGAREIHKTSRLATAALGRALSLVGIMGTELEGRQTVSIQVISNGPLKGLFVQSDADGNVRGYIRNPYIELPPSETGDIDVETGIGKSGYLYVVKDMGFGNPYIGITPLVKGGIATDLAHYFYHSEQTPSVVAAGTYIGANGNVEASGGMIGHILPGVSRERLEFFQRRIESLPPLSELIRKSPSIEAILKLIFERIEYTIVDKKIIRYHCPCNKERARTTLILLGKEELYSIMKEGHTEVTCVFCGTNYYFGREELEEIISAIE